MEHSKSINSSLFKDAIQRPVPQINGMPSNGLSQLLPVTDPRVPSVGQHTFGDYKPYISSTQVPDWRQSRSQRETTPLQRELAREEAAALQRLRASREEQRTSGSVAEAASDTYVHQDTIGYSYHQDMGSARERASDRIGAQVSANIAANNVDRILGNQQQEPLVVQRRQETHAGRDTRRVNPPDIINECLNVERVPIKSLSRSIATIPD